MIKMKTKSANEIGSEAPEETEVPSKEPLK